MGIDSNKSSILFISLNHHQKKYFSYLGKYLESIYNVYYVHYGFKDLVGALRNRILPKNIALSPIELEEMQNFLLLKAEFRKFTGIRGLMHTKMILERQARSATSYFYNYIVQNRIDLVCIWNGTLIPLASAAKVAKKLGKKTLYFENGYLPSTTTVDPTGVNNQNSLVGKNREFYDAVAVNEDNLVNIYTRPLAIRALKRQWYQRLLKRKPSGQPENIMIPSRFVFLPFQVHDDTQVLLHSPQVKTMEELVSCVVNGVKKYNLANDDDLWIIAKEHPSDFGRVDYSALRRKYENEKIVFLRYYPTPELIKKANGIITLNSSVGIESLIQHKPVITLGNAFYNVDGLVCHVENPDQLAERLSFIDSEPDHALIDRFLYYLRYCYLAQGSWRQPDAEHYRSVAGKIASVLNTNK